MRALDESDEIMRGFCLWGIGYLVCVRVLRYEDKNVKLLKQANTKRQGKTWLEYLRYSTFTQLNLNT